MPRPTGVLGAARHNFRRRASPRHCTLPRNLHSKMSTPVPELPAELVEAVFTHLSVFGLYDSRKVCKVWLACANRIRNANGALKIVGSCGGKLGRAKSIHPSVRGKIQFPITGLCGFGDGFLLVGDHSRHRLMVVQTSNTAALSVNSCFGGGYSGGDHGSGPTQFNHPSSVLHCRTNDRDVFYVADSQNGYVKRLYAAEFFFPEIIAPAGPTPRSVWVTGPVDSTSWMRLNNGEIMKRTDYLPGSFRPNMSVMAAPDFHPRPPTFFGYFDDACVAVPGSTQTM